MVRGFVSDPASNRPAENPEDLNERPAQMPTAYEVEPRKGSPVPAPEKKARLNGTGSIVHEFSIEG